MEWSKQVAFLEALNVEAKETARAALPDGCGIIYWDVHYLDDKAAEKGVEVNATINAPVKMRNEDFEKTIAYAVEEILRKWGFELERITYRIQLEQ